jgi:uncharacterized membrane protein YbhN (UPF0104 family)
MEDSGRFPPGTRAKWIARLRVVGTIASLCLLGWLIARQDWRSLIGYARALPAASLLLGLGLVATGQLCNVARWLALLRGQGIPMGYPEAARLAFAGLFASNFLPSTIGGDVVRMVGAGRAAREKLSGAATVVMDRMISVFGMLFLLPFSALIFPDLLRGPGLFGGVSAASSGASAGWVRRIALRLRETLAPWARRPGSLALALLASWAGVLCYLVAVWAVARGLSIEVGLAQVAGVTGITYLLTIIPISINGYGVREAGMLALYAQLGASPEQASALALITRGLMMLVSLPGAAWLGASMAGRGTEREQDRGEGREAI